jgi:hypothetical protein
MKTSKKLICGRSGPTVVLYAVVCKYRSSHRAIEEQAIMKERTSNAFPFLARAMA